MSATIRDVAKLAGVSVSTVSRVINNASNVNDKTRQNVMDAIKKLNFKPNRIAQSLGSGSFNAIGVVSTRSLQQAFHNPYFSLMIQAIGEVSEEKNYDIILNNALNEEKEIEKCLSMIESKIVQGLILLSSRMNDRLIEKLYQSNIPFVVVGRVVDERLANEVYSVDTDNLNDCKEAVSYLIKLGHKRIGCIHAPLKYVVSVDRLEGYIAAHKESGLPVDYSIIENGQYTINDAYQAAINILKSPTPPTAIFATDDIKAIGAYKAIKELNLKIPDDISLVGHNNYEYSTIMSPELTTIDVPIEQLGKVSAKVLFDLIEGRKTQQRTLLKTKFIIRQSCKAINENSLEPV
ncbi:LacI family DNA-binding transcriptional regulator [Tepidanaerobacter syntrophicus]|uniref:LacI family DNA-binding transcriptional regulator n=1 Tax=Tepidanaerobacter syntrophicus TaxID=224999 RepID=UPI001BD32792